MRWFNIFERSGLQDCEAAPDRCRKSILQVATAKEINSDRINYLTDSGTTLLKIIPALACLWLLAGCPSRTSPDQPPNVRYGEDACDECRMIISEARYAAAYVTHKGQPRLFDDLGCMLEHNKKELETIANYWANDYKNPKWLNLSEAYLVKSNEITTPMGYGIIVLGSKEDAAEIANQNNGEILSFDKLKK